MKERFALNFEMPAVAGAGAPPIQLMLIPPGKVVKGRDGRKWNNPFPQRVVDSFTTEGRDFPVDIEHSTHLKAPKGEAAPAVAWGKQLTAKADGSIWATLDWNPKGHEMVMNREYRYYSPVFIYDRTNNNILGIASVGLTNKPNLEVTALNHEGEEKESMLKKLLVVLGLPETTTEDVALNHVTTMKTDLALALNRAQAPDLALFVPRGDYDAVLGRATNAEQQLQERYKAELETALNAEIDAALKAGKIVPATKDFYIAMCRQEGGLEKFKEFAKAAPVIGDPSKLDDEDPNKGRNYALNTEERKFCEKFGISAEDYHKAKDE
ncbi:phage protease [Geomonas sp. Red32]|uniref:phage protease n=1 Tax=Geomonas sp. Red32 TaxID=2912856 RepID=UPI00202CA8B4|nr:phage protease [Geomonas sp. Red32]MCM0081785.1 phage protease [Geomonas sp. Red32]